MIHFTLNKSIIFLSSKSHFFLEIVRVTEFFSLHEFLLPQEVSHSTVKVRFTHAAEPKTGNFIFWVGNILEQEYRFLDCDD